VLALRYSAYVDSDRECGMCHEENATVRLGWGSQGLGVLGMSFRVISLFILILVHMVLFILHSDGAGLDL
jgi:hypothetical protein